MAYRHLALIGMILGTLVVLAGGCGPKQVVPRDPADVPGYLQAPPELAGIDPSPLRGRRILVDPGHGGRFRGAVGDLGLTEAEVNLGVALYLQGLLQWAGAEVTLTRTADVDFLTPADSSLTADLAARVALCDSLQPDVFVSIHHNSTASRDPHINETQTYYPLGREGADLDLARAIHRQLVRALDIEPAKILPGGFYVLRHAPVPAVLGEPAMISNPVIEGRLSLARSLELEASAYFLGLREYFAAGTPRWLSDLPDTVTAGEVPDLVTWTFDPGTAGAPGLDPTTIAVSADHRPVAHVLDAAMSSVTIQGRHLAGARSFAVTGRNLAGRATPAGRHAIIGGLAGAWRTVAVLEDAEASNRRALLVYRNLGQDLDRFGPLFLGPVADPTSGIPLPRLPGPLGALLLDPAPEDLADRVIIEHRLADAIGTFDDSTPAVTTLPRGQSWRLLTVDAAVWPRQLVPGGRWRLRGLTGLADLAGQDPEWPAIPFEPGRPLWLEADGARPLFLDETGRTPWQDPAAAAPETLAWQPLLPALVGKRVALDPRGGGIDDQGRGPFGTTGSELNLQVATRLAALLRGAGCEVVVVREGELWTPDPEKVRRADSFAADLYLAIGRGRPAVRHHPGSSVGAPWAAACAAALDPLLPDTVRAVAAYDYVLRHTACPALVVVLETPTSAAVEDRLAAPAWQNAVARALLRGAVALLQPGTGAEPVEALLDALGERALPAAHLDHARLDGNFLWLPPSGHGAGSPVTSWVAGDPGLPVLGDRHVLELHAGPLWQLWALDRLPSGDWRGRILLENR